MQSAPQLADGRQKLEALTALRFVAAACIVLHHLRGSFGIAGNAYSSLNLGAAVSFFFVLSGFVLAYAHPRLSGLSDAFAFIVKRWFRIWPLHFACLVILLILMPPLLTEAARSVQGWLELVSNILLVQAWVPWSSFYFSFNPVSWSISIEWFFYLSFPFLLYLMLGRNSARLALLVTLLPLIVLLVLCAACDVPDYSEARSQITTHGLIYINPFARLFEFAVGMALQRCTRGRKDSPELSRRMWILQLLALALAAWFIAEGGTLNSRQWMPHVVAIWFGYSGGLPIWAFLIWAFSFSKAWPAAFLSNRVFVALGEASFAIYLVHFGIAQSAAKRLCSGLHIENSSFQLALYFGLVVGVSFFLYYAIERPGMALGKFLAGCVYSKQGRSKSKPAPVQEIYGDSVERQSG